jgi:hypothetical protein
MIIIIIIGKGHAHKRPQGPKGVPGRLRPRTFSTTRVVGRQPHAPAAFTPREKPWYSFLEAESTPGHIVLSVATEKNPQCDTTGNRTRDLPACIAVPPPTAPHCWTLSPSPSHSRKHEGTSHPHSLPNCLHKTGFGVTLINATCLLFSLIRP